MRRADPWHSLGFQGPNKRLVLSTSCSDLDEASGYFAEGPKPEVVPLFDHLVGACQHHGRDDEVERLGNF